MAITRLKAFNSVSGAGAHPDREVGDRELDCAGIPEDDPVWGRLSIARTTDTESLTKEKCLHALAGSGSALLPAWLSLLERFDRKRAASRNASFRYFLSKHLPEAVTQDGADPLFQG